MINYDTIKSVYEDKLTLMQWLVKVQKALKDATAVSFDVNKRGDATLTFSILFDDGTELETDPIILEQGESVESATLRNGHLILTLTNGDELDAGNMGAVSGFFINSAQHLIVQYQDGTTNDLGAIFNGSISINGNISATGNISASGNISGKIPVLTTDEDEITAQKPVVENMAGYSFTPNIPTGFKNEYVYVSAVKNGHKLTFVLATNVTKEDAGASNYLNLGFFEFPDEIGAKLYPTQIGGADLLADGKISIIGAAYDIVDEAVAYCVKASNHAIYPVLIFPATGTLNQKYYLRYEITFLLSANLAE